MMEPVFGGEACDLLIIGAGPAGLSAAVNARARNLKAIVIEAREPVSKVRTYPDITNYLGFAKTTGAELANHFYQHFSKTGCPFKKEKVLKVLPQDCGFGISTDKAVYQSRTIILAVGVAQTALLPGEEQFLGRGVSYCVTCDGALFRDKDVVVVGYVPEGEEEANALAGLARQVTYVAAYENVEALDKSVKLVRAAPVAVEGDSRVRKLRTESGELRADGIFIVREAIPPTTLLDGLKVSDDFVQVGRDMATSVAGVYAAGDCTGPPFQIAKAVGEGQVAALSAARFIHGQNKEEGMPTLPGRAAPG